MYYDKDNYRIAIEDKRNGYVWRSAVEYDKYDEGDLNNLMISRMTALFDFKYTNTTNKKYAIVSIDYNNHKPEVSIESKSNGLKMLYKFSKLGISIPINISVEKNILTAHIPVEKIRKKENITL